MEGIVTKKRKAKMNPSSFFVSGNTLRLYIYCIYTAEYHSLDKQRLVLL